MENYKIIASIPAESGKEPAYYHSYSMTTNHVIFLEMPYRFNLFKMLTSKLTGSPPAAALEYRDGYPSIIKLANVNTGEVLPIRIETEGLSRYFKMALCQFFIIRNMKK